MTNQKKILIVDDEPDMVEWLQAFFEDNGYATITAMNGVEGLEKTLSEKPDLITLDITMDKETGIKMFRKLNSSPETENIPVIMITGISQDLGTFLGRQKNVKEPTAFFEKPVDKDALLKSVKDILKD